MQVGEAVGFGEVYMPVEDCPFDHNAPKPPTVKNDLVGVGKTLASRMKVGSSAILYKDLNPGQQAIVKNPRAIPGHPFYDKQNCVEVQFTNEKKKSYPVTCAAHHLVPAQESLKGSSLLAYMCKKSSSEEHNHSYGQGLVWSDVGYDVNGSENGVFLPGSYAVGGGRGGLAVWYPIDDEDHDEPEVDEDKKPAPGYEDFLLSGQKGQISKGNPCWWYVGQAVKKCPGQFHDRHKDYSERWVQVWLNQLAEKYKERYRSSVIDEPGCNQCKERSKKFKKEGHPTPYGLVKRINHMSERLKGFLNGRTWRKNIYTSTWGNKQMMAAGAGGPSKEAAEMFE